MSLNPKMPSTVDAGNAAVHVIQQIIAPRPVSVADDDQARALFGFGHKPHTYRALGVAMAPLPGNRFVVLVADVEKAIRDRGTVADRAPRSRERVDDELGLDVVLTRAGLRVVGRRK